MKKNCPDCGKPGTEMCMGCGKEISEGCDCPCGTEMVCTNPKCD